MKMGFYPRFAVDNIRKNKKLYLPYLITCVMMVAVCYLLCYFSDENILESFRGEMYLRVVMQMGTGVIGIFSAIFLVYTNSFLLRKRKREFGLYSILGMNRRNIGKILAWESLLVAAVAVAGGILSGVLLSKLSELVLLNLIGEQVDATFRLSLASLKTTGLLFAAVFFGVYLISRGQIHTASPAELAKSENFGEKPPKANWLLAVLGTVILAGAYYLAVSIQSPLQALSWFFVAVVMVIIATYMIMIAGSVALCRLLQKNKRYYYRKNHFISVSSMVYRMKRNGAGLASICILATMVLVMISTTTCMYFGVEESLDNQYPRQIMYGVQFRNEAEATPEAVRAYREGILRTAAKSGTETKNVWEYRSMESTGVLYDGVLHMGNLSVRDESDLDNVVSVYFLELDGYNSMGHQETLQKGEVLLYFSNGTYPWDSITVGNTRFSVAKQLSEIEICSPSPVPGVYLIFPSLADVTEIVPQLQEQNGSMKCYVTWHYCFDTELSNEGQADLVRQLAYDLSGLTEENIGFTYSCRGADRASFYNIYGGLFFLGVLLSIVFLVTAVLILYYKQVSEGYEDQSKFAIMRSVGLTGADIRKSINSQMLIVFFLPLGMSILHLCFAFPMVRKLLTIFYLTNTAYLVGVTAVSVAVFALIYGIVYRITSNTYYSIVNGGSREKQSNPMYAGN